MSIKSKTVVPNVPQIIKIDANITLVIKGDEIQINGASSLKIIEDTTPSFPLSSYGTPESQRIVQLYEPPPRPISHHNYKTTIEDTIDILKAEIDKANIVPSKIKIIESSENYDSHTFVIYDDDGEETTRGNIYIKDTFPNDDKWIFTIGSKNARRVNSKNGDGDTRTLLDRLNIIHKINIRDINNYLKTLADDNKNTCIINADNGNDNTTCVINSDNDINSSKKRKLDNK